MKNNTNNNKCFCLKMQTMSGENVREIIQTNF